LLRIEEKLANNNVRSSAAITFGVVLMSALVFAGCGASVEGNTYTGNGGIVVVEFKSGGKAFVSTGPVSTPCTYTASGKTVVLTCEGDKTTFTVDDDGALIGPPNGMLGRLTKKK
jgi:hypothetical protein